MDYTQQKTWSLDSLGNNLAAGTYDAANEETPTVGSSGYDLAGNMTTLQSGDTAVYDAWDHLVKVRSGSTTGEQYEYDGTGRRIQIFSNFSGGTPGTTEDDYLSGQQVIETRENTAVKYQQIWSPRYIDSAILRDTYSGGSIVQAARVFYLSDANYNVTGLVKCVDSVWGVAEHTPTPPTYRRWGRNLMIPCIFPHGMHVGHPEPQPRKTTENSTKRRGSGVTDTRHSRPVGLVGRVADADDRGGRGAVAGRGTAGGDGTAGGTAD